MPSSLFFKLGASLVFSAALVFLVNFLGDTLVGGSEQSVASETPATPPSKAPAAATPAPPAKAAATEPVTEPTPQPVAQPTAQPVAQPTPQPVAQPTAQPMAKADTERGRKLFRKCKSCHTPNKGGGNRVGPNLWDVLGRPKASAPGYRYSKALAALGGNWTATDLDAFLTSPKAFAKGTKMSFRGFKKPEDRAAIIGFLGGLSEAPKPLTQDGR